MSSKNRKQSGPRSTDDTNNDLEDLSTASSDSITLHDEAKEVRELENRLNQLHVLWMETRLKILKTELESSLKNDPRAKDVRSSKRKSRAFKVVFGCALVLVIVAVILGVVRLDTTDLSSAPALPSTTLVADAPSSPPRKDALATEAQQATQAPADPPTARRKFQAKHELEALVDYYLKDDTYIESLAETYGWPIGAWDVSGISDFSDLFSAERIPLASDFNQDLSGWDTSSATNMRKMFYGANSFNRDISMWNVSNVQSMAGMFTRASAFNQNLRSWKTNCLEDTSFMFEGGREFNGDVSTWDLSKVKSMQWMFSSALAFDQPLASWNTSSVTDFSCTFCGAVSFNQDVSSWNVSSATNLSSMFNQASAFNQDLAAWKTSRVTSMRSVFYGAASYNHDLSAWDVSNVKYMEQMFAQSAFNQDLSSWNTSQVINMISMFSEARSFNQDVSTWNVSNVRYLSYMFQGASSFNQSLCAWGKMLPKQPQEQQQQVKVEDMFHSTSCPAPQDPDLSATNSSLCHPCPE
jgi:surface protein